MDHARGHPVQSGAEAAGRHVLSVAAEYAPLVKVGGLADVAGALPGQLRVQGWEMLTLLPRYGVLAEMSADWPEIHAAPDFFGGRGAVRMGRHGQDVLLLLDAPHLFGRPGTPYGNDGADWPDNPRRFAALACMGAALAQGAGGWHPQILHAHDWHAALAPCLLRRAGSPVKTVLTIHNAAFQGVVDYGTAETLGLPAGWLGPDLDHYGHVSLLKGGILCADAVTTVSPRYAWELLQPETGMAMDPYLRSRGDRFRGILNGVEAAPRPPAARVLAAKHRARAALLFEFGLTGGGPLAVIVSRLTGQKGLDIVMEAWAALDDCAISLIVLGTGEPQVEAGFRAMRDRAPGRVGLSLEYSADLAQRLFLGGDCILIPSRFEPCGLTQMQAMAAGTVPVATAVGGLADTIIDATPAALRAGAATGVLFPAAEPRHLSHAVRRLCALHGQPGVWRRMQLNGMRMDFGWSRAAAEYAGLYDSLAGGACDD